MRSKRKTLQPAIRKRKCVCYQNPIEGKMATTLKAHFAVVEQTFAIFFRDQRQKRDQLCNVHLMIYICYIYREIWWWDERTDVSAATMVKNLIALRMKIADDLEFQDRTAIRFMKQIVVIVARLLARTPELRADTSIIVPKRNFNYKKHKRAQKQKPTHPSYTASTGLERERQRADDTVSVHSTNSNGWLKPPPENDFVVPPVYSAEAPANTFAEQPPISLKK